jgi:hypothetical protein
MRKSLVIAFAVLAFTPAVFAKSHHDWQRVEKLKSGTPVLISLWSGRLISGSVDAVGPGTVRVDTADPDVGVGSLIDFARADIWKIERVRRSNSPDPHHWMAMGALIGAGVGFTAGGIYDVTHHENYNWIRGGLGGAALGYFGSAAVLAGVATVDLFHHHDKVVYEDQRSGKMRAN